VVTSGEARDLTAVTEKVVTDGDLAARKKVALRANSSPSSVAVSDVVALLQLRKKALVDRVLVAFFGSYWGCTRVFSETKGVEFVSTIR